MPREINDAFAYNAAYNMLLRLIGERDAHAVLDAHPSVRWEREVNGRGVAVRRYVLRGEWEADPEAVQARAVHCAICGGWNPDRSALAVHLKVMHSEARETALAADPGPGGRR
jgi:hypothetical protein